MSRILISPYDKLLSHSRFLLQLRSQENVYSALILFRLSSSADTKAYNDEGDLIKEAENGCPSNKLPPATENPSTTTRASPDSPYSQIYVMESACPHLGADMSHADIEECETGAIAVCPWHRYDFDLRTGKSETGLQACTYRVEVETDPVDGVDKVYMEAPKGGTGWKVVELRPVSEEFADPPPKKPVESQESKKPRCDASCPREHRTMGNRPCLGHHGPFRTYTSQPPTSLLRRFHQDGAGRVKTLLPPRLPPQRPLPIHALRQHAHPRRPLGIRHRHLNPATIEKFRRAGDAETVDVMEIIHADEVTHVTAGHRWFVWACQQEDERNRKEGREERVDPVKRFREEVKRGWTGEIKGPFNVEARERAGLTPEFYQDLRGELGIGAPRQDISKEEKVEDSLVNGVAALKVEYE